MRFALLFFALPAVALPTTLELKPGDDTPYEIEYSQGIALSARLAGEGDVPIAGERVTFTVTHDDGGNTFTLADPVTDAAGVATARLTFVDGRYGGQTFPTALPPGEAYTITATFLGANCAATDADTLCSAETTIALHAFPEVPTVAIEPGIEVALSEEVVLVATLKDDNGDAPEAGTDLDGDGETPIADAEISFFYDADGNGRPSLDERLGSAITNSNGVATFPFTADPSFVTAANTEAGLHVQFGGDQRYALAGAAQDLVVLPGAPDANKTIFNASPTEVPANGFAAITLTATLVDAFNNTYGEDEEIQDVVFTTTLADLVGDVAFDPITGVYSQELNASLDDGVATVQVIVNGVAGPSLNVTFTPQGCNCGASSSGPPPAALAIVLLLIGLARINRR